MVRSNRAVQLFSIVLIAMFALMPLISAQAAVPSNNPANDFFKKYTADIKEFFVRLADYRNNNNLTVTVLFFILVFMVIGSIIEVIPLFAKRKPIFKSFLSLVITTLSVFLIPKEILAL